MPRPHYANRRHRLRPVPEGRPKIAQRFIAGTLGPGPQLREIVSEGRLNRFHKIITANRHRSATAKRFNSKAKGRSPRRRTLGNEPPHALTPQALHNSIPSRYHVAASIVSNPIGVSLLHDRVPRVSAAADDPGLRNETPSAYHHRPPPPRQPNNRHHAQQRPANELKPIGLLSLVHRATKWRITYV